MALDIQPAPELDVQPAPELDVQPAPLDVQPAPAKAPALTEPLSQLTGRSMAAFALGRLGESGEASMGPIKPIPRWEPQPGTTSDMVARMMAVGLGAPPSTLANPRAGQELAGAVNAAKGVPEFMESIPGVLTSVAGAGGRVAERLVQAGWGAFMAHQVPAQARAAGTASVEGTPAEQTEAYLNLGGGVAIPAFMAGGLARTGPERLRPAPTPPPRATPTGPGVAVSEFGGDTAPPLDVQAAPPVGTAPPVPAPEASTAVPTPPPPAAAPALAAPVANAEPVPNLAAGKDQPTPESEDTLNHQLDAMRAGKRAAVLFTPGEPVPKWAQDSEQYSTHETPAGTFLYDAAQVTRDQLSEAVRGNHVGRILGYGIDAKPAPESTVGAVVVRDPKGIEKQAVLTDAEHLTAVLQAAQAFAGTGDSVRLERPEDLVAARQAAAVPAVTPFTERQRMVQENIEAMAALSAAQRESEEANATTTWNQPAGGQPEHSGIPQGPDLSAHQEQIREGAGERPGGGGGPEPAPEIPAGAEEDARRAALMTERGPDIIDWLEGEFPQGIKTTSASDYGSYVKEATGAARELLSNRRGEPADNVLEEAHRQGLYHGLQNQDDLLQAILDAAQARKGGQRPLANAAGRPAAKTAKVAAGSVAPVPEPNETELTHEETAALEASGVDPIENWFNDAIQSSRDRSAQNAGKLFFRPDLGLSEPLYRTALQVIREAYVRLRDLKGAIEEGISWLRSNATGWDEAKTRAEFQNELQERATSQKILSAPGITEAVKQSVNQYLYERAGRQEAQVTADGLLEHYGLDTAMDIWRGAWPEVPMDVRAKLIGSVARELRRRQDAAPNDLERSDWTHAEGQWWNEVLPRNTELGQYISALDGITAASPEGYVAKVRQEMEAAAAEELDRHAGDASILRNALDAGRQEGLTALRADPRLNEAAKAAVDEFIKRQAGTLGTPLHQGIVMELVEPWRSSPTILSAARDAVRAKADELLNKAPRPPGLTAPQHLRQILDDLAQRGADIFASHIQGSEPDLPIVQKLMQRLGIDRPRAQQLATALSKEWDRQLDAAKAALDTRLAKQRARQLAGLAEPEPNAAPVDRLLRGALREANLKLGDILNQEANARVDTGQHLADRVVSASGLAGDKADALRTQLRQRYDDLVTAAQDKKLASLQAAAQRGGRATTLRGPLEKAWRQLQQLDRLAPVDGPRFYNILKDVLGLPRLTEDQAAELRAAVRTAQKQPAGFLQQRAMIDVMKLEGRIADAGRPWWTKPISRGMGIFYANMLSGLTTYAKIPFENLNLFAGHTLLNWLTRPGELVHPLEYTKALAGALRRGYGKGAIQALDTLRTGTMTGVYEQPKPPGPLEMQPFGKAMEPLNFWKWFTRAIGVAHETTFKPAWELKTTLLARELARSEGLKGQALDQRVADLLGNTQERVAAARAQAVDELARTGNPNRIDLERRTQEIIEQQRERDLPGITRTARDYAQRVAYLNPSYGFLGAIGDQVVGAIERLRGQFPFLGAGVKSQIPFVKVATNIVNEKLNWSPLGLVRAWEAGRTGKAYGRPMLDPNELAELYAKGITGTVALAGLWALRAHIHGAGPTVPQQQQQLKAAGWIPHSIEWNGKYYSYDNTPLMLPMALVGNAEDWARYGKGSDDESATRLAYALKGVGADIFSQGYLDSVGKFFEAIGNRNIGTGASQLEKITARTGGTFLFPNLLNQVDRIWDPMLRDQSQLAGLLQAQVPFVRRLDKPTLNALGEPVSAPPFHTWFSPGTTDPLWQALAQQRAWVPEPATDLLVGDKKLGPDYVRAMTPEERYALIATSGPLIRAALEQHLGDSGLFDVANLPPAAARKLVGSTAAKARAQALREMQLTP